MHKALQKPFFIFGDARSGNTFLSYKIMAHMNAVIPPESSTFIKVLRNKSDSMSSAILSDPKFEDWDITQEELDDALSGQALSKEQSLQAVLDIYCKKHGGKAEALGIQKNYIDLYPSIHKFMPNAKIIWLIRDGRAVFNSKSKNTISDGSRRFETDPKKAALIWLHKNIQLGKYQKQYGNVLKVHYEDLVNDTEGTLRVISKFLELPYSDEPLSEMSVPPRYSEIHQNVGDAALPERQEAWKDGLSAEELKTFEIYAAPTLEREGYDLQNALSFKDKAISGFSRAFYMLSEALKIKIKNK